MATQPALPDAMLRADSGNASQRQLGQHWLRAARLAWLALAALIVGMVMSGFTF